MIYELIKSIQYQLLYSCCYQEIAIVFEKLLSSIGDLSHTCSFTWRRVAEPVNRYV
jgi:hypothetical protein